MCSILVIGSKEIHSKSRVHAIDSYYVFKSSCVDTAWHWYIFGMPTLVITLATQCAPKVYNPYVKTEQTMFSAKQKVVAECSQCQCLNKHLIVVLLL